MCSSYTGRIERIEVELCKAGGGEMTVVMADSPEEAAPQIAEARQARGRAPNDRRLLVHVMTRRDAALL